MTEPPERGRPRFFPPNAKPLPVVDGLKARSKRGAIAQTWWSERFIAVLQSIVVGGRLDRGRAYARKGQVISMDVGAGSVTSLVQGSSAWPYEVSIGLPVFTPAEWTSVERALAGNAWYLAKLLAGEMPEDIEDVFGAVGLSLFPPNARTLSMECSCPDWSVPCKHIAATFYLLAESFDEDPFRILAWRGRGRQELLGNLHAAHSGGVMESAEASASVSGMPLESCLESFFSAQAELVPPAPHATSSEALLDQLPPVQIAVRGRALIDLLRPAYTALGSDDHD